MKKMCVVCDVCGSDIVNGRTMWTQKIVDGRGRHGNQRMDMCERCFTAFQVMLKQKGVGDECTEATNTDGVEKS